MDKFALYRALYMINSQKFDWSPGKWCYRGDDIRDFVEKKRSNKKKKKRRG